MSNSSCGVHSLVRLSIFSFVTGDWVEMMQVASRGFRDVDDLIPLVVFFLGLRLSGNRGRISLHGRWQ